MKDRKPRRGLIFVVSGPSGSGKTTLVARLLQEAKLRRKLGKSISFTTRPKRSKERQGRDYIFITPDDFRRKLKAKKILEWTRFLGYDYATPRDFAERQVKAGKSIILCLDRAGAKKIKTLYPRSTITIFIVPPSLEALRQRIAGRCHKTKKEEIARRLRLARREIAACRDYDFTVVNKNLHQAVKDLRDIILS
ncbi:MAG: guanylate kinase, partial [Candidatus Omnitrophota bacterium]|nr:guanylate kinase [Candidatus Omnitrophota bacterium]